MKLFEFIVRLQEHNALEAYINNVKRVGVADKISELSEDFPVGFLLNAFVWSKTPEGHGYWQELEEKISGE